LSLRLPTEEYQALCQSVMTRDGWKCRSCKYRDNLHVHHIQYRSHQGPDESWNLITLCNQCHDATHAGNLELLQQGGNEGKPISADLPMLFIRLNNWRPT
jgi:5-methylcytosine-specific restriction endonuclease McrA